MAFLMNIFTLSNSLSYSIIFIMFSSFGLFCKEYQRYLKITQPIDVRLYPSKLIQQLKKKSTLAQFKQMLMKKTKNGFRIMRRLTVVHLLMMNTNQFSEVIQHFVQHPINSDDEWLNQKCIRTYYRFLKKAFISHEYYIRTKQMFFKSADFQIIFYSINLFADLFQIIQKMPLLGRYYKDSNLSVTCSFIEAIAVQSQKLYSTLKNGVAEILTNHKIYIKNIQDQELLKAILEESLVTINEQMKKLFLDKYFYPLGKGICIKLFRIQQQNQQTIKIIKGIMSNHQQTQRIKAYTQLQQNLFPEEGKFNLELYERTLRASNEKKEQYVVNVEDVQQLRLGTKIEDSDFEKQNQLKNLRETSHLSNPDNDMEVE